METHRLRVGNCLIFGVVAVEFVREYLKVSGLGTQIDPYHGREPAKAQWH